MESRSQPQRDALLAFKLLTHCVRFAHWHSEAKADKLTSIAVASWALAVVIVNYIIILAAHPGEDDTSFATYLYKIILAFYKVPSTIVRW